MIRCILSAYGWLLVSMDGYSCLWMTIGWLWMAIGAYGWLLVPMDANLWPLDVIDIN